MNPVAPCTSTPMSGNRLFQPTPLHASGTILSRNRAWQTPVGSRHGRTADNCFRTGPLGSKPAVCDRSRRLLARAEGSPLIGPEVQQGVKDAQEAMQWSNATVVANRAESADGSVRTLVLSVEDPVEYLEGRRMKRKQKSPRWIDNYKVPGQFVGIRYAMPAGSEQPEKRARLFAISSSPYDARRDSADLDASIIEVLVDRAGGTDEQALAEMGPGAVLEVSQVSGRGYASLFNSYVGLLSALEEQRDLLLVGVGAAGLGPLRSVLEWTPVQAHATAQRVSVVYAAPSQEAAAYLKDWDRWREAGMQVEVAYLPELEGLARGESAPALSNGNGNGAAAKRPEAIMAIKDKLEEVIFLQRPAGLAGLVPEPREAVVLLSGLPGDVAASLSRRLTMDGVARERILFCDFF